MIQLTTVFYRHEARLRASLGDGESPALRRGARRLGPSCRFVKIDFYSTPGMSWSCGVQSSGPPWRSDAAAEKPPMARRQETRRDETAVQRHTHSSDFSSLFTAVGPVAVPTVPTVLRVFVQHMAKSYRSFFSPSDRPTVVVPHSPALLVDPTQRARRISSRSCPPVSVRRGGKRGMLERHLARIEAVRKKSIRVCGNATASYAHVSEAVWVNMWSFTVLCMGYLLFSPSLQMLDERNVIHLPRVLQGLGEHWYCFDSHFTTLPTNHAVARLAI